MTADGKHIVSRDYNDDGTQTVHFSDGSSEILNQDESPEWDDGKDDNYHAPADVPADVAAATTTDVPAVAEGEVSFLLGNKHNPVIVLGDDPSNTDVDIRGDDGAVTQKAQDNILVSRLPVAESVPRNSVYGEEAATDA